MKYLIFGDLHVNDHKQNDYYFYLSLQILEYLFNYAINNKIQNIIFLGDIFEKRTEVNIYFLTEVRKIILKYCKKINIVFIIGNHDMYFSNKTENNILEVFEDYGIINKQEGCFLIKQDGNYKLYGLNYTEDYNIKFDNIEKNSILFTHNDIITFLYDNDIASQIGFLPENFKNFDLVFNGHYHTTQEKNNIVIVGSPYKYKTNHLLKEVDSGFYVLDISENGIKKEFKSLKNILPKLIKIEVNDDIKNIEDLKLDKKTLDNNYVYIIVNTQDIQFLNYLKDYLVNNFNVIDVIFLTKSNKENSIIVNEIQDELKENVNQIVENIDSMNFIDTIKNILIKQNIDNIEEKMNYFIKIYENIKI